MPSKTIDQLIINSPYREPAEHWKYDRESRLFSRVPGRRPAGYVRASESSKTFDDPGVFVELPLPNKIRPRVNAWRDSGYPSVSGITKRLLEHWRDPEQRENHRLFFCQLEAIETLIWLTEAPSSERIGINIPTDGGDFPRLCSKMATGSGKTIVMAMLIAWQILNKVTYPQDKRFSKNIFVVAPGLTVKNRLQVLVPGPNDYYQEFGVIPAGLEDKLRQGKVLIRNWHALDWDSEERIAKRKTVDKRGALSDGDTFDGGFGGNAPCVVGFVVDDDDVLCGRHVFEDFAHVGFRTRRSHEMGRRPRSHPPNARHPNLFRSHSYSLRSDRQAQR
jgi:type III restriction enzyme